MRIGWLLRLQGSGCHGAKHGWQGPHHGPHAADRIAHYYSQFNSPAARGSALATLRATADTRAIVAHTAKVSCNTLVVWGRYDAVYPPALGRRLAKHIAGAGLELMPTGHAPQEEAPGELAELIARFCRQQRAT